ncbi:hypothetical protein DUI87_16309 [Hirundo rustica rustica]|uniref:Uncharacterized protein n=1 Tax=Hirundo rustica rustica TaxID=333673 RepID=A0A3M0K721_HIRRU|nr:hypothetical protein DUI87_16309 [Hirundo rustica rustica]
MILLLYPHETPPGVLHRQLKSPQPKKSMDLLESREGPQRGSEGWSTSEDRLRDMCLSSMQKRRLMEGLIASFQCLKEALASTTSLDSPDQSTLLGAMLLIHIHPLFLLLVTVDAVRPQLRVSLFHKEMSVFRTKIMSISEVTSTVGCTILGLDQGSLSCVLGISGIADLAPDNSPGVILGIIKVTQKCGPDEQTVIEDRIEN